MSQLAHHEFRAAALKASAPDELWEMTCAYLAGLGFEGALLAEQTARGMTARSNIDAGWAQYAADEGLFAADPFFRHCFRSMDPLLTGKDHLALHPYMDKSERTFVRSAAETGLTAGLSVPLRLPSEGGLTGWHLLSNEGGAAVRAAYREHGDELQVSLFIAHQRLAARADKACAVALSPRELDCLNWCAEGLRTAAIADKIGISESTVELHLRNARRKLSARTREHAIAIALRQGILE